jgi:endonuclease-3
MQLFLDFAPCPDAAPDLIALRRRLLNAFGPFRDDRRREPMDQLVRSMICGRTQDAQSDAAYARLKLRFQPWSSLLEAPVEEVVALLGPVTFARDKAARLYAAFARIKARTGAVGLDTLADMPVDRAYIWLRGLQGVGAFAAAATLNFSTLRRRVFAVDTHGLRVLQRFGLVADAASVEAAADKVVAMAPIAWSADDFYELHWLLKRLGQTPCSHASPRCGACPLSADCAHKAGSRRAELVPVRSGARPSHAMSGSFGF